MLDTLQDTIKNPAWVVMVTSMLPLAELRGAIPLAILGYHMSPFKAYILGVIGNLIPIIPLIIFFSYLNRFSLRYLPKFWVTFLANIKQRGKVIERYESLGLLIFVAIPLPLTGAWSGAILAFLFGLSLPKALLAITGGVLSAGGIVTLFLLFGAWGAISFGVIFLGALVYYGIRTFKIDKTKS